MDVRKGDRVRITTEFTVTEVDQNALYYTRGRYFTKGVDQPFISRKVEVIERPRPIQVGDVYINNSGLAHTVEYVSPLDHGVLLSWGAVYNFYNLDQLKSFFKPKEGPHCVV